MAWFATTLLSISPLHKTEAAVSSQDDSIPNMYILFERIETN
jgi:hypothetical protein